MDTCRCVRGEFTCAMLCRCGFIKATENTKIYHTEFNISLGYNWMYERTVQEIIRFEADKYCIVGPGLPTICILQELLRFITVYCKFYCSTNRYFRGSSVAQVCNP